MVDGGSPIFLIYVCRRVETNQIGGGGGGGRGGKGWHSDDFGLGSSPSFIRDKNSQKSSTSVFVRHFFVRTLILQWVTHLLLTTTKNNLELVLSAVEN